jgi:hypothetical protein
LKSRCVPYLSPHTRDPLITAPTHSSPPLPAAGFPLATFTFTCYHVPLPATSHLLPPPTTSYHLLLLAPTTCPLLTTCQLPAYHLPTTCLLPAHYLPTTCLPPAYYLPTTCQLPAHHLLTTCSLLTTRPPPAYHLPTTCPLPAHHRRSSVRSGLSTWAAHRTPSSPPSWHRSRSECRHGV